MNKEKFSIKSIIWSVYAPSFLLSMGQGILIPVLPIFARDTFGSGDLLVGLSSTINTDYAKSLQMLYPIFNIHVVDMYKWLLLPPDLSKIDNHNYLNKELDNLIKSNNQSRESTQQMLASGLLDDTSVPVNFENVHPNLIQGVAEPKETEVADAQN